MTKQRTLAALLGTAAVLAFYGTGAAQAQVVANPNYAYGPYVGVAGGGSFLNDVSPNGGGADNKSDYDNGYVGLGTVGWGFGNGFRAELEGGYRRNDVRSVRNSTDPNGGALGTMSVMVNGLYDIDPGMFGVQSYGFMPHVGVGVGWARPRFDHAQSYNGNTVSGKDDVLAYQGIAGVSYTVMPQVKLDLDYRYFGTAERHVQQLARLRPRHHDPQLDPGSGCDLRRPLRALGPAGRPGPAAGRRRPRRRRLPPPSAPEVQRAFQVFFDFNKSDITSRRRPCDPAGVRQRQGRPHDADQRDGSYRHGRLGQVQPGPVGAPRRCRQGSSWSPTACRAPRSRPRASARPVCWFRPPMACASRRTAAPKSFCSNHV
jgi:OOP family OmpA-OmpF porin